ncbi:hypothetical protein GTA08_BOTSDO04417 [Neofusicoccum parvum]|uniref:Uncharacterized protein n=1 Tax=Neofusicoccum parvum TaxID=310453 RepID=A0ACB5S0Y2_9PEZI|nr:hypothetical protein GTA08_BOTSDO04417 [Neofusicoccum parvum]
MTTPDPLCLPYNQRSALLTGPTVSLSLPQSSMPTPHTIPSLPRRMLFAFSRLAASRLSVTDGVTTTTTTTTTPPSSRPTTPPTCRTITLPTDACSISSLEYLVLWMKASCRSRSAVPIVPAAPEEPRPGRWRWVAGALRAARALDAPEAERLLVAWVKRRLAGAAPGADAFRAAVEALEGVDGRLVQVCLRSGARFAQLGRLEERAEIEAWLRAERPGLWELWEVFGERAEVGRELMEERQKVAVKRLREKARVENDMVEERMAREAEKRLERQRRLAGLIE